MGGGRTFPLTDDSAALQVEPRWSPDGSQLLFRTSTGAAIAPALGGHSREIVPNTGIDSVSTASWSPDGREVVYAIRDSIFVVGVDGQSRRLVAGGVPETSWCRWSAGLPLIACVSGNAMARDPGANFANKAPSAIVVMPAAGGRAVRITSDHAMNQSPEWSPAGDRLFFISNRDGPLDVYEVALSTDGTPRSSPMRVTTGLNARSMSITTDARRVAYSLYVGHANIYSLPIPASGVALSTDATPVTAGAQTVEAVSVSPDGKWIAYDSDRDGLAQIYRISAAGGEPEQLTNEPFDSFAPSVSPDGRMVAYHSFRTGTRDIEVKPISGGAAELVTNTPAQECYPEWSPNGNQLLFIDQRINGGVYVTTRFGPNKWSAPRRLRYNNGPLSAQLPYSQWSPDGKTIASKTLHAIILVSPDSGASRTVYTAPPDAPLPETMRWSGDGRSIYFKTHDAEGHATISVVPAAGGAPRPIVRFPDLTRPSFRQGFAISATHFYFPIEDRQSNVWIAELSR